MREAFDPKHSWLGTVITTPPAVDQMPSPAKAEEPLPKAAQVPPKTLNPTEWLHKSSAFVSQSNPNNPSYPTGRTLPVLFEGLSATNSILRTDLQSGRKHSGGYPDGLQAGQGSRAFASQAVRKGDASNSR